MKNVINFWTISVILLLVFSFSGCASTNSSIEKGKSFMPFYGRYHRLKPIEEQSILINLAARDFTIGLIDGIQVKCGEPYFGYNNIIIVQPGTRRITWRYPRLRVAVEGTNTVLFDFEPGQYYIFTGEGDGYNATTDIKKLNEVDQILYHKVYATFTKSSTIQSDAIKKGIDNAIKRGMFEEFVGSIKTRYVVFDKNIPKEQQATLYLRYSSPINIIQFSGKRVNWKNLSEPTTITIPSGEHTMILNKSNKSITNNFQPGHRYYLDWIYINENRSEYKLFDMTSGKLEKTVVW